MSDLVTQNVKFIFNKSIVISTSRVVIAKLDDESNVIFRRVATCSMKLIQLNPDSLYLKVSD